MAKNKKPFLLVAFGVVLYVVLTHVGVILSTLKAGVSLVLPLVVGFILAFVLNVPMTMLEKQMNKIGFLNRKLRRSTKHLICMIITLCIIGLMVFLIVKLLVPEIQKSVINLYETLKVKMPQAIEFMKQRGLDTTLVEKVTNMLDINTITSAGNVVSFVFGFATSILNVILTIFIGVVIAAYSLLEKDDIKLNFKKALYGYCSQPVADNICFVSRLIKQTYYKFFSGQVIESIILGLFMYISLSLFRIPYAGLIGLLTGASAYIPYLGAFLSCGIGVALLIIIDPGKALLCLIVYQVVQFIENQFIYPHVVGSSVGLSALWTLVAVVVGGSLFGVVGMIFFIPLMSVCAELMGKSTNKNLEKKKLRIELRPEGVVGPYDLPADRAGEVEKTAK